MDGSKSGCPGGFLLPSRILASHGYLSSGSLVCGLGFGFGSEALCAACLARGAGSLGRTSSGSYFHFCAVEVEGGISSMTSSSSSSGRGGGDPRPGDEERFDFLRGAVDLLAGRFLFFDLVGASESSETTKSSRSSTAATPSVQTRIPVRRCGELPSSASS